MNELDQLRAEAEQLKNTIRVRTLQIDIVHVVTLAGKASVESILWFTHVRRKIIETTREGRGPVSGFWSKFV